MSAQVASLCAKIRADCSAVPGPHRSPAAAVPAVPQAGGFALPPTPNDSSPNSAPNPQRALSIAVSAISNGITSAINTVQQNTGGGGMSPPAAVAPAMAPAPALATSPSSIGAFLNPQPASISAASSSSSGANTGAIVGGARLDLSRPVVHEGQDQATWDASSDAAQWAFLPSASLQACLHVQLLRCKGVFRPGCV